MTLLGCRKKMQHSRKNATLEKAEVDLIKKSLCTPSKTPRNAFPS
jgi:hypothetical protein